MVSQQEGCAQLGNLLPLPSASSDNASESVCVRGEEEQMGGGGPFLLFYSWSLVVFCLLTMQICRNSVTFPVVLTAKGKKRRASSKYCAFVCCSYTDPAGFCAGFI